MSAAGVLVTLPTLLVMITKYVPAWLATTFVNASVALVALGKMVPVL